jgi:hypothetical protein
MNEMATLNTALLDLSHELRGSGLKLIVGGGFGIYLKYRETLLTKPRTVLHKWPEQRSTNDLDLFLRAELLIDSQRLMPLVNALNKFGYKPVETAKYYQFFKPGPTGGESGSLKVDILTGPEKALKEIGVVARNRRAYPKPKIPLHARTLNEALTLEENLQSVTVAGYLTNGRQVKTNVFLPHAFTFLMMKLFALRDRIDDAEKDYGRHHALDLYMIIAMMKQEDWKACVEMKRRHEADTKVIEASTLVKQLFGDMFGQGVLRLKENKYYRDDFQVKEFLAALKDLFNG